MINNANYKLKEGIQCQDVERVTRRLCRVVSCCVVSCVQDVAPGVGADGGEVEGDDEGGGAEGRRPGPDAAAQGGHARQVTSLASLSYNTH